MSEKITLPVHVYSDAVEQFVNRHAFVETLGREFQFTEGPIWNGDGAYLFSDITANCIYRQSENGATSVYLEKAGTATPESTDLKPDQAGPNGLAFYNEQLLVCRHGSHDIAVEKNGALETFVNAYNGRRFNSPNDLIVHHNGTVYFSDPPYGLKDGVLSADKFQPLAGVYAYRNGEITLICDKYQYPNGVCLSPDGKTLFVCSNKPFEKFISMYDAATAMFKGIFAEENSDGIEVDRFGNIYLCNKDGIIILDERGQRLALISLTSIPSNACWGGISGKDLFITARKETFLIRDLMR